MARWDLAFGLAYSGSEFAIPESPKFEKAFPQSPTTYPTTMHPRDDGTQGVAVPAPAPAVTTVRSTRTPGPAPPPPLPGISGMRSPAVDIDISTTPSTTPGNGILACCCCADVAPAYYVHCNLAWHLTRG